MDDNIGAIIKHLGKTHEEVYAKICKVTAINTTEKTVDVKPIGDSAEIFDVRLQAESDTGGLVLIPNIGSLVLVVFLDKNNAAVVNTSEVSTYELKIKSCELFIDQDGFLLKKENETLKILMADLIAAIKKMKFTTNNGPTINLINIQDFISIERRFNQFLK
jgi:hypothetical protein